MVRPNLKYHDIKHSTCESVFSICIYRMRILFDDSKTVILELLRVRREEENTSSLETIFLCINKFFSLKF